MARTDTFTEWMRRVQRLTPKNIISFIILLGCSTLTIVFATKFVARTRTPSTVEETVEGDMTRREVDKYIHNDTVIVLDWTGYNMYGPKTYLGENCIVSRDRSLLNKSHAVFIPHSRQRKRDFPKFRRPEQRWIWFMDESPMNSFYMHEYGYEAIRDMFNWTMTYRTTSDVYIPYGWTTRRETPAPIPSSIGNRSGVAVSIISNCGRLVHNNRFSYVRKLQKYTSVEIYGNCVNRLCGEYHRGLSVGNCQEVKNFLFYLSFENSNCKQYVSEKTFAHGFSMGTVPVIMGAPKSDYIVVTPPNSFIHVDDFSGPKELGEYLTYLSKNKTEYMKYHDWRRHYITSYRTQYVDDEPVWEALCKALKNDTGIPKRYGDMAEFWTKKECQHVQTVLT